MTTFYVSLQSGSDNNNGLAMQTPFATVNKALEQVEILPTSERATISIIDSLEYTILNRTYNIPVANLEIVSSTQPVFVGNIIKLINGQSSALNVTITGIVFSGSQEFGAPVQITEGRGVVNYNTTSILYQIVSSKDVVADFSNSKLINSQIAFNFQSGSIRIGSLINSRGNLEIVENTNILISTLSSTNLVLEAIFSGAVSTNLSAVNFQLLAESEITIFGINNTNMKSIISNTNFTLFENSIQPNIFLCADRTNVSFATIYFEGFTKVPVCRGRSDTISSLSNAFNGQLNFNNYYGSAQQSQQLSQELSGEEFFLAITDKCTMPWNGGIAVNNRTVDSTNKIYDVKDNDAILTVNVSHQNLTINIPQFEGTSSGRMLFFRRIDDSDRKVRIYAKNQPIDNKPYINLKPNRYINLYRDQNTNEWYCIGYGRGLL